MPSSLSATQRVSSGAKSRHEDDVQPALDKPERRVSHTFEIAAASGEWACERLRFCRTQVETSLAKQLELLAAILNEHAII